MLGVGCFKVRGYWYPIMLDLHRFMIAVARVTVNHDGRGGTAPDPLVWDQGGRPKALKLAIRVNVDLASLSGPPGFLGGPWIQVDAGHISGADIAAWPYSVGILYRFTFFLVPCTGHWPPGSDDFGHFGVSFLELLILLEQWAGHRLLSEKVTRPHVRANRPILIPSVPVSEGIEIRHGCQFLSSLVRALAKLLGGIGWFLQCMGWLSYVQIKASWMEPVFSWSDVWTIGILSSSVPQGCVWGFGVSQGFSFGASRWHTEAPTLNYSFYHAFSLHGLYLGLEMESGKRQFVTPGHLPDEGGNADTRVRLTRKTRPGVSSHSIPDPGHPTPMRWKRLRSPSSEGEGGELGVPRNLFPRLGVG